MIYAIVFPGLGKTTVARRYSLGTVLDFDHGFLRKLYARPAFEDICGKNEDAALRILDAALMSHTRVIFSNEPHFLPKVKAAHPDWHYLMVVPTARISPHEYADRIRKRAASTDAEFADRVQVNLPKWRRDWTGIAHSERVPVKQVTWLDDLVFLRSFLENVGNKEPR